jgi:hypothetical protein
MIADSDSDRPRPGYRVFPPCGALQTTASSGVAHQPARRSGCSSPKRKEWFDEVLCLRDEQPG